MVGSAGGREVGDGGRSLRDGCPLGPRYEVVQLLSPVAGVFGVGERI